MFDLLTIALGGFVAAATLIYLAVVGVDGPGAKQGVALLAVVGLAFFAFWGIFAYNRKKWLDSFDWFPNYNLMIQSNGYSLPAGDEIDGVVLRTIQAWKPFHARAGELLCSDINWVYFRKDLNETALNPTKKKVNGFTVAGSHVIEVDFNNKLDSLEKTAFAHELGHVIHGLATGGWDQEEHHRFMNEHGLS